MKGPESEIQMRIKDPRSPNYKDWVNKYRKVDPVVLEPSLELIKSTASGRREALSSGLDLYTGDWTEIQRSHLLRRCLFGIKKEDLDRFSSLSMKESIDQLLVTGQPPLPPVNDYNTLLEEGLPPDPDVQFGRGATLRDQRYENVRRNP